jgi:hypothetical protein
MVLLYKALNFVKINYQTISHFNSFTKDCKIAGGGGGERMANDRKDPWMTFMFISYK